MNEPQAGAPPDDLASWELHCFCLGAVRPPARVVRMEENGRLLHRARAGTLRRAEVAPGTAELLELYGLVARDGEFLRLAFPIVGPSEARTLRDRARSLARRCLPHLGAPVAGIVETLRRQGLAGHASSVVFGHAIDGLMWTILASRGALPETRLTVRRPFWNGTFWAIWPPREEPPGVNEAAFPGMSLVMVWTPRTEPRLKILAGADGLEDALHCVLAGAPGASLPPLPGWRLADPDGRQRIPVIRPGDALDLDSLAVARHVAGALLAEPLPGIEGIDDPRDARVVFGHELIWEIADLLRDAGLVPPSPDDDPVRDVFVRVDPL